MRKNKGWCWFVHHDIKLEYCTDFAGRVEFIKENKDPKEVPARLFALRWVKGKLPKKLLEAWAAWDKAGVAYDKAGTAWHEAGAACGKVGAAYDKVWTICDKAITAYYKAGATWDKAEIAYKPQIDKLFAEECSDIPWDEENQTLIFE